MIMVKEFSGDAVCNCLLKIIKNPIKKLKKIKRVLSAKHPGRHFIRRNSTSTPILDM